MTKASPRPAVSSQPCPVCGKERPKDEMIPAHLVRPAVAALIRRDHPDWSDDAAICLTDLHSYRMENMQDILTAQKGELSDLDKEVMERIHKNELMAENVEDDIEDQMTRGARIADRVASFGGSWTFIGIFGGVIVLWMFVNVVLLVSKPFDPYPFILLNLVLSCLAAVQAPVIMMSQNRRETKDRARAEHDYQVNLKAELEIRLLHEKIDHLLLHQWRGLMDVQELQTDLIEELAERLEGLRP